MAFGRRLAIQGLWGNCPGAETRRERRRGQSSYSNARLAFGAASTSSTVTSRTKLINRLLGRNGKQPCCHCRKSNRPSISYGPQINHRPPLGVRSYHHMTRHPPREASRVSKAGYIPTWRLSRGHGQMQHFALVCSGIYRH